MIEKKSLKVGLMIDPFSEGHQFAFYYVAEEGSTKFLHASCDPIGVFQYLQGDPGLGVSLDHVVFSDESVRSIFESLKTVLERSFEVAEAYEAKKEAGGLT